MTPSNQRSNDDRNAANARGGLGVELLDALCVVQADSTVPGFGYDKQDGNTKAHPKRPPSSACLGGQGNFGNAVEKFQSKQNFLGCEHFNVSGSCSHG